MIPFSEDKCCPFIQKDNPIPVKLQTLSTIVGVVTQTGKLIANDSPIAALDSAEMPWEGKEVRST